ncbi:hypothetical protein HHK36_025860 [Tetracentron sinense]|uniref:Uncharacterized protein n=1 Tax=Tetracentron sinense TaxID=13715 RepID=A0A834YNC6_TETSI|nr:hypothetical protein HHK36_025860 [Tetracentron sinense]
MPLDRIVMDPLTRRQEHEWVLDIRQNIEEGLDDVDEGIHVSIFNVPKTLISIKQEAYIPQQVALGPYHHWRSELYELDRYKLSSARRTAKQFRNIKLQNLVEHFAEHEANIRACYHSYLDFGGETLAWMFAVDASFLLEYLQIYAVKNGASLTRVSSKMTHLVDYTRRKIAHHVILRDIIMLENQIPLFLLRDLHRFCELEKPDEVLAVMLVGLCKDLCPIKMLDYSHIGEECLRAAHLLELLYYMVVPELQVTVEIEDIEKANELENDGCCKKALNSVCSILCFLNLVPIRCLGKICKSENFRLVIKLPWNIIKQILKVANKNRIQRLISSVKKVAEQVETVPSQREDESPLIEELTIPSVTELSHSGIKFRPSKGGLGTIEFDKASATFYLPILKLNENSEVVLRNLIAYEASIAPKVIVFTRYTELMNGIIDSEEDVKLLREAGIILNCLKSDEEVATLWNCMSKSVETTKVPILDKVIKEVNTYHSATWNVKTNSFMKRYVFGSWKCLTFLAANLLLLLTVVQAFCSMYKCSR